MSYYCKSCGMNMASYNRYVCKSCGATLCNKCAAKNSYVCPDCQNDVESQI